MRSKEDGYVSLILSVSLITNNKNGNDL